MKCFFFLFLGGVLFGQTEPKMTLREWKSEGRPEVLDFFSREVYGVVPAGEVESRWELDRESLLFGGEVIRREYLLTLGGSLKARILAYLPKSEKKVPAFLGLNFEGNHTVDSDEWVTRAGNEKRGKVSGRWPVEMITKAGFAVLTVHCDDFDPDRDDQFQNGVHSLNPEERNGSSWGTIAGWAWGLSRILDHLPEVAELEVGRVAVIGHSRLGKTALWAGASDERFAMVISNNSGCGGAALSKRKHGETVKAITERFPHWFAGNYKKFGENEEKLLFDQDRLIACVAPRPIYVASASQDDWADPEGEFLALGKASSIYKLYGVETLEGVSRPAAGESVGSGPMWYHVREGRHEIKSWDWERYLKAAEVLKKPM